MSREPSVRTMPAALFGNRYLLDLSLIGLMIMAFMSPFLFFGKAPMMRDLLNIWTGYQAFYRDSLLSGALPFWEHFSGCGEPFLADPQSGSLYPFSLIFLVLSPATGIAAGFTFHLFIAALGAYLLCRCWRISPMGSLLAAVGFSLSTMTISRMEFYAAGASFAWCPMVLAAYAHWLSRPGLRRLACVSFALTLQVLAGYPEAAVYTGAALACHAACVGMAQWRRTRAWRPALLPVAALGLAVLVAGLLLMVQILPSWEAQSLSQRAAQDPELNKASLHPLMLATAFLPYLYGTPGLVGRYWAPSCYEYWIGAFYVGLAPLVILMAAGLNWLAGGRVRKPLPPSSKAAPLEGIGYWPSQETLLSVRLPFLLMLLILFTLYAMGKYTPFFTVIWHVVPILQKFRWPTKGLVFVALALSCLSGLALDWLARVRDDASYRPTGLRYVISTWMTPLF